MYDREPDSVIACRLKVHSICKPKTGIHNPQLELKQDKSMILAADNLHALDSAVRGALENLDPEPLQSLARRCEKAGAQWIDLNPGYLSARHQDRMAFMVETVQEVTSMRLILDSPHARILGQGLSVCQGKPILNALTLEEKKLEEILPLAVEYKTDLIILLLDERSFIPPNMEEKVALALELRERALAAGLTDENLIFDPVLPNLSWHDGFRQVSEVISTVRMFANGAVLGEPVKTIVGLSNLRSGLKRLYPSYVEQICLSILAGAGLQCVLANALEPELLNTWRLINQVS